MSSLDSINVNKAVSSQEEGERKDSLRKDSNILDRDPVSKQETAKLNWRPPHGERE